MSKIIKPGQGNKPVFIARLEQLEHVVSMLDLDFRGKLFYLAFLGEALAQQLRLVNPDLDVEAFLAKTGEEAQAKWDSLLRGDAPTETQSEVEEENENV